MADLDAQYGKWSELVDKQALGVPLSAEEAAFCERFAAEHPACQRELELLSELADLDVAPNAESRALVDAALARLADEAESAERNQVSELKRGARVPRFVWASGAAAALAIGATLALLPHKPASTTLAVNASVVPGPRVELVYAAGEVKVDGKPVSLSSMLLPEGSLLEVGRGSACIAMDPEINVCAAEGTQLRLSRTHSVWRKLDLLAGEVALQLAPQPEGYRLSVVADGVWSTAVGTAFTVERDADEGVKTTVLNGKVRVGSEEGHEQMVAAHERVHVHRGASQLKAISRSDESPEWALLRPSKLWLNPVSSTLEVRGLPPGAEISLDDQIVGVAPLSSLVPAGAHKLDVLLDGRVVASRDFVSEVGQVSALSFDGLQVPAPVESAAPEAAPAEAAKNGPHARVVRARAPAQTESVPAEAPAVPAPSASELLSQARRLLRSERFDEAVGQYQALRQLYPASPEARTVLVSLAEVELDRLGQPRQALENLDRYLGNGGGSLIEEARRVRIRALAALGDRAREQAAIVEFLDAHPRSFQAVALKRRLAELQSQP